jgi:PAS domain S-box-containing protein
MRESAERPTIVPILVYGALFLLGLYGASLYSYLLFHSIVEVFSIVIACSIFVLAWNSRRIIDNSYLVIIGIAYLFVGGIDFLHTLAYKGMRVFPGYGANLPTQLWIAGRYLQGISFLIAPLLMKRTVNYPAVLGVYFFVSAFLVLSIFTGGIFPDCYLEGVGLTSFKILSEYVISSFFVVAIVLLLRRRKDFDPQVLRLLCLSLVLTVFSELAFTLYVDVYGFFNYLGHSFKVAAFYFSYKALIETGLVTPYNLLFRNLKQSEEALRRAHDELELRVKERTAELTRAYEALKAEGFMRERTEEALRDSERKYSQVVESSLTGIYIDQDTTIVFCNQRFADIFGYSREEMIGLESWKIVHPEDRAMTDEWREKRLRGEPAPAEYEARGLTKDGRTLWVIRRNTRIEFRGRPAVLGNIVDTTRRKQMEGALMESEKELRLLSTQLLATQENERKWVAQELHDSIGQSLVAVKFALERKIGQSGSGNPPPGISLEDILSMVQNGVEETRRIMTNLRPSILDDLGILATVNWFCREFQKVYPHIQIQRQIEVQEQEVPDSLKIVIFRILQEAMNNIAKHSRADTVVLGLARENDRITLRIQDNGIGFDPENCRKGLGLSSMKERTQLSGGIFILESGPGKGSHMEVRWPAP